MKKILDACCGSRVFWFDRENQDAVFADNRELETCKIDVVLVCIEVVSRRERAVRHDIPVPPCERGPARLNP